MPFVIIAQQQSQPVSSKPQPRQSQQLQGAILSGPQPQQTPSVALVSIPLPYILVGGCLTHFLDFWRTLTSDQEILQTVSGLKIDFIEHVYQTNPAPPLMFTPEEELAADKEIKSLLECGVIVQSVHEEGEFISNVFLRPKKTGGYRMILNLKKLNKYARYNKFKMETLLNILDMMEEGCFQTSIDFDSAYLTVGIHPKYHKYLKVLLEGCSLQICSHALWFVSGSRIFTELLKPPLSLLRLWGTVAIWVRMTLSAK